MRGLYVRVALLCVLTALVVAPLSADVKLPALFTDNMVLQRGIAINVWGLADAGEQVTVTLCGQQSCCTADKDGKWMAKLDAMEAGGPFELGIAGKNNIALKNVMLGDVWVCSGQSNMAMVVRSSFNRHLEEYKANYPNIRLFTVGRVTSDTPQSDVKGSWAPCSPESVAYFSAVGYFFGRELHKRLNVPIGLINTSWGGTPAEAWTSLPRLEAEDELKPILDRWETILADYPAALEKYNTVTVPKWQEDVKKAKEAGKTPPRKPREPLGPTSPHRPANLYNAMIAPLLDFPIKGAIWYQGESNAGRAYQYRKLFRTMIEDWRDKWEIGDFPFFWVQLANFMAVAPQPQESAWAELREAQTMTLSLPNTGQAVIIEIGEATDIHPKNKQDVGKRLAMSALGVAYGQDVAHSGPLYDSMCIEGDKIRIRFKYVFDGLMTPLCAPVNGFAIAGEDKKFVWADAEIDGDTIVVSTNAVKKPIAVRYGWGNNPVCNLYNGAGLPASPFRTDDWPGLTVNNK